MKKILLSLTAVTMFAFANSQTIDVTLVVDMNSAQLGEIADGICTVRPFDPSTDVVEAMGQEWNSWTGSENAPCNGPYTADAGFDFVSITPGIYVATRTITPSATNEMTFKFRINHSWDNDELRGVGDGNRHYIFDAGATSAVLGMVFDVDGIFTSVANVANKIVVGATPNPFSSATKFTYVTTATNNVSLKIYDTMGQLVTTVLNENQTAGAHHTTWNGTSANGAQLANGLYYYTLTVGNNSTSNKIVLSN